MNVEYFNITYRCNSNCLLCAANIGTGYRDIEEMSLDDFLQAIANRRMKANDRVIINGGEPTTSEYFFDILDACNSRSFFIDLFTNGKKFSDRSFCERVLECLNIHIRIPLFGCQETHDQLTGQTGNFNDVINGIKNIHLLLQESQSLEIKLLLAETCIEQNPDILLYLLSNGLAGNVDITLNPLLISKKVLQYKELFVNTYTSLMQRSMGLLINAEANNVEIGLQLIPFCVMPKEILRKQIAKLIASGKYLPSSYNDKRNKGDNITMNNHMMDDKCRACSMSDYCSKFPSSYLKYYGNSEIKPIAGHFET